MKTAPIKHLRIHLTVYLLFLTSLVADAAPERRTALIIGNSCYETGPLRNPVNDAAEMANAENGRNIILLDACRDNPFSQSFRSSGRGLAIVSNAPSGTFISYSTGPNQIARDGGGRNSPSGPVPAPARQDALAFRFLPF